MVIRRFFLLLLLVVFLPGAVLTGVAPAAMGQQRSGTSQTAQTPPTPTEPQATSATFGDWTLRCVRQGEGAQAARSCEIVQTVQAQGQAQQSAVAQYAFGRIAKGEPLKLTLVLPASVSFPSSVQLMLPDNDSQPTELPWRRCLAAACVADMEPVPALLQRWRSATETGRLQFRDAAGRDTTLPFSFRGLAPALDALAREAV